MHFKWGIDPRHPRRWRRCGWTTKPPGPQDTTKDVMVQRSECSIDETAGNRVSGGLRVEDVSRRSRSMFSASRALSLTVLYMPIRVSLPPSGQQNTRISQSSSSSSSYAHPYHHYGLIHRLLAALPSSRPLRSAPTTLTCVFSRRGLSDYREQLIST